MTPRRTDRPGFRAMIAAIFLLISAAAVFSAVPELEVSVGFDNLFRQNAVSSLGIVLRSPDSPMEGELIVEYHAGTALEKTGYYRIRRPVSLPAGFSGVYRFTLPVKAGTYPLTVRLERNGVLVVRKEVELRPMVARGPIIVGLSRRPSLDALIAPLAGLSGNRPELRYPRVDFLPVDSRGWDGADLVLWHNLSPDELDPEAGEALAGWVSSGGLLVVFEGPWNVDRLLPAAFGTLEESEGYGRTRFGRGTILIMPPGLSAAGSREAPVIVQEIEAAGLFGDGMTLSVAADSAVRQLRRAVFSSDGAVAGSSASHLPIPLAFSLICAALLFVGKRITGNGGRWLQMGALAAVAVLTSSVVFLLPASSRDDPEIRQLNAVVAANSGPVFLREELLVFSPRGSGTDISLTGGQLPVPEIRRNTSLNFTDRGPILEHVDVAPWRRTDISLESVRHRLDGLSPVSQSGLRHPGGKVWRDVVLVSGGRAVLLAGEWHEGDYLMLSEEAPLFFDQVSGFTAGILTVNSSYRDLVGRLARLPGGDDTIMAFGGTEPDGTMNLLLHLGDL